jgi:hypothetical protein
MVKNIPDSLTFPFTVWMAENGFYPCTKKNVLAKKGSYHSAVLI